MSEIIKVPKPRSENPLAKSMEEKVRLNVAIDPALRTQLKLKAIGENKTVAEVVTQLIEDWVKA